jgi:hypothetical protein
MVTSGIAAPFVPKQKYLGKLIHGQFLANPMVVDGKFQQFCPVVGVGFAQ